MEVCVEVCAQVCVEISVEVRVEGVRALFSEIADGVCGKSRKKCCRETPPEVFPESIFGQCHRDAFLGSVFGERWRDKKFFRKV